MRIMKWGLTFSTTALPFELCAIAFKVDLLTFEPREDACAVDFPPRLDLVDLEDDAADALLRLLARDVVDCVR